MNLDEFDYKILRVIQRDAECSMADLGDKVGLSHTPCWRRVKRMEEEGIITGRVALLDPQKLDLGVTVFADIMIKSHDEEELNAFELAVQEVENVVECYSSTGDRDYLLHIVAKSVDHYERILKRTLVHLPNVAAVNSNFALKMIKHVTYLPI